MEAWDKKPEDIARDKIDAMLEDAGWKVVGRDDYDPTLSGVAIREGLMMHNKRCDYFLFLQGKAVGVLEAKRFEVDVTGEKVCEQTEMYARGCPKCYKAWQHPLPLCYQSNGHHTYFRDFREEGELKPVNSIYTPLEMARMLGIDNPFAGLPAVPGKEKGLRKCQVKAITNLEKSFREGSRRALISLATGAGKTYTAILATYRFLAYTPMKKVLFLVDRNNLGKQAVGEFGTFRLTQTGDPFNIIYSVDRLKTSKIPHKSDVIVSTIQSLFSVLKGEPVDDSDEYDMMPYRPMKKVELPEHPLLAPDFFDLIIVDECHRSIYGNWRSVLEYFSSAHIIGLTATPVPETLAFFDNNMVVNYTLDESITDGVNVDGIPYRIKTSVTENGGAIREGAKVKVETKYTGQVKDVRMEANAQYSKEELNKSIINPAQIKLVLETYKEIVYDELYKESGREPDFDCLPKTLIFAINEQHAANIVTIAKEVFGHNDPQDPYVQKITYSSGDSEQLIRSFRNDKDFRIAVTCTLVATGTDIKPLEVLIFMRDVMSETLFTQMKGRGVRTIGDEQLRSVTPNAHSKDCFYIVDAVGVTEHTKIVQPVNLNPEEPALSLRRLLELITHGNLEDDNLHLLAGKIARIARKSNPKQLEEFKNLAGCEMKELAENIFKALSEGKLPAFRSIDDDNPERTALVFCLISRPKAREFLLILNAGFITTLMPGEDTLIYKGFSVKEAQEDTEEFEKYCKEHKDDIEALRILWNNLDTPISYSMLKELENTLIAANRHFAPARLWNAYALIRPDDVRRHNTKEERTALTNIIQLVRFAFHQIKKLESALASSKQYFNLWCGQHQDEKTQKQIEVMSKIVEYIATNGECSIDELREWDPTHTAQIILAFGNREKTETALYTLTKFIIYRKTA